MELIKTDFLVKNWEIQVTVSMIMFTLSSERIFNFMRYTGILYGWGSRYFFISVDTGDRYHQMVIKLIIIHVLLLVSIQTVIYISDINKR